MPSNRSSGGSADHRRRPLSKDSDEDAPPTNTLWVGSLSSDTVDLDLLDLFSKHGALDCSMMRTSRSYAFVYFKNSDEAKAARDALQGTVLHGSAMKIDYAIPSKPCKRIWIGGISSSTRKEEIENEFVKFGKIEEYKFYRDRNSALIDYFKTDDAIAAKKNMNGKQLGGEQIRVDFLRPHPFRKEWASHHDSRDGHFSRNMGPPEPWISGPKRLPRRDGPPSSVLWIGHPPSVHIDEDMLHNAMILFGEIERVKCFPERHYSFVEFRSVNEARRAKEGLQGRLFNDPRIQIMFSNSELAPRIEEAPPLSGPGRHLFDPRSSSGLLPYPGSNSFVRPFPQQGIDPHEFGNSIPHFPDGDLSTWVRRSPSVPGMNPSGPYIRPPFIPMPGGWDGFDTREPKRSRFEGGSSSGDPFPHARRMDAGGDGDHYGFSQPDRGTLGQIQPNRAVGRGHGQLHTSNVDHIWRGVIAKGGTHVCHARCLPLGKGIDSPLPGIINCSARTGLDMLARYYTEASGFDIVFFLPDSEEDFAAYTEFLQYLGQKNRAGVAKLDDGTTLFLVPPSHFLSEILNVSGPERLYGVVLKVPQQSTSSVTKQPHFAIPRPPYHHTDQQKVPDSHESYNFSQYEDETRNHNRHLHEESMPATSQVEVSLTPELIATLASLIPSNIQQRATGTIQTPLRSSVAPPSSASLMQDESMATHPHQQLAYQYNNQTSHISQFPTYSNNPNGPDHSSETFGVSTQTQYPSLNIPQASAIPVDSLHNYSMASQAGQLTASQNNQQYQMYSSSASHNNFGNVYANLVQQPKSDTSSVQVQAEGLPQPPQFSMPLPTDQLNVRLPIQEQQGSQDDPEKNQRYQSTLQFAANLLLQIQQQQQQQQQQQVNGQPAPPSRPTASGRAPSATTPTPPPPPPSTPPPPANPPIAPPTLPTPTPSEDPARTRTPASRASSPLPKSPPALEPPPTTSAAPARSATASATSPSSAATSSALKTTTTPPPSRPPPPPSTRSRRRIWSRKTTTTLKTTRAIARIPMSIRISRGSSLRGSGRRVPRASMVWIAERAIGEGDRRVGRVRGLETAAAAAMTRTRRKKIRRGERRGGIDIGVKVPMTMMMKIGGGTSIIGVGRRRRGEGAIGGAQRTTTSPEKRLRGIAITSSGTGEADPMRTASEVEGRRGGPSLRRGAGVASTSTRRFDGLNGNMTIFRFGQYYCTFGCYSYLV